MGHNIYREGRKQYYYVMQMAEHKFNSVVEQIPTQPQIYWLHSIWLANTETEEDCLQIKWWQMALELDILLNMSPFYKYRIKFVIESEPKEQIDICLLNLSCDQSFYWGQRTENLLSTKKKCHKEKRTGSRLWDIVSAIK